jgi:PTH1 family peptidyl-tRNA hydrolase
MFVIAGLGNPGKKYANTRHNVGFEMVDAIAAKQGINIKKVQYNALCGETTIAGERVVLMKPQTFMNLSGMSISQFLNYYKIPVSNLVVIYDDVSLELGRLRIRERGSSGGHNGMKNIIASLGTEEIARVRIGIGEDMDARIDQYVLSNFSSSEVKVLIETAIKMPDIIDEIIKNGVASAMNLYNGAI